MSFVYILNGLSLNTKSAAEPINRFRIFVHHLQTAHLFRHILISIFQYIIISHLTFIDFVLTGCWPRIVERGHKLPKNALIRRTKSHICAKPNSCV